LQHSLEFKQEGGKVEMIESIQSGAADNLIIVRAWYGGTHMWLWQGDNDEMTNRKKGKIVTDIVRRSLRADGALDFNPAKESCNNIFGDPCFGCHKILAVEYRYGNQPVNMWFSPSNTDGEPYACFLPARRHSGPHTERLVIHSARYGWAHDIWNVACGSGRNHGV
jgi:hypothetical protein